MDRHRACSISCAVTNRRDAGFSLLELLVVVGLTTVIAAIAVPMMSNTIGDFRIRGDARAVNSAVSLAKLRAASGFTQTRLFVDLSANSFHVESCQKAGTTCTWVAEGGTTTLATNDTFSFGAVSTPPSSTQTTIGQADELRRRPRAPQSPTRPACCSIREASPSHDL